MRSFLYLLSLSSVFFITQFMSPSAKANAETAPANTGYTCQVFGSQPLPSGQKACERMVASARYTNAGFVAPGSCSFTTNESPPRDLVASGWVGFVAVCPGGSVDINHRLGFYS